MLQSQVISKKKLFLAIIYEKKLTIIIFQTHAVGNEGCGDPLSEEISGGDPVEADNVWGGHGMPGSEDDGDFHSKTPPQETDAGNVEN